MSRAGPITSEHERALERLIAPTSLEQFFAEYWERRPLWVARDQGGYFADLLDVDTVHEILSRENHYYPAVAVYHEGTRVSTSEIVMPRRGPADTPVPLHDVIDGYAWPHQLRHHHHRMDMQACRRWYERGATIHLRSPPRVHPPIMRLCTLLEEYFACDVHANVFLCANPRDNVPPHWDNDDNFILHIAGRKRWRVWQTPLTLRNDGFEPELVREATQREPDLDVELTPGDSLFIPRGMIHAVTTLDAVNLHLGIGTVPVAKWELLAVEADAVLAELEAAGVGASTLEFGPARADQIAEVYAEIRRRWRPERARQRLIERVIAGGYAARRGQLEVLSGVLTSTCRLRRRPGLASLQAGPGELVLHYKRGIWYVPASIHEAVRWMVEQRAFRLCDVPGIPRTAQDAARWLCDVGFLELISPTSE